VTRLPTLSARLTWGHLAFAFAFAVAANVAAQLLADNIRGR
jgi:hypothetical protein